MRSPIALILAAVLVLAPAAVFAADHAAAPPAASADAALSALKEGNRRFVAGRAEHPLQDPAARAELAAGQHPGAIVFSCSDSRVPPELVFDQGLGQIFTVRTAGEVADYPEIASVEYAVEHLGARLIVVLGHESCGAVKAALDTPAGKSAGSPDLDRLVAAIRPGVAKHRGDPADKTLREAVAANARAAARLLTKRSKILRDAVAKGEVEIVPAVYGLATGQVEFFPPR